MELKERYLAVKRALFDRYYADLNEQQRKAVYQIKDPLLILAGAGSGKTTVLVRRIAYMIKFGNAYHNTFVPADYLVESHIESLEKTLTKDLEKCELEAILSEFASNPCPPWQVLAITFTNKAAAEIKNRLKLEFESGTVDAEDIWAGTFHSICMRILRRYTAEAGLRENFTIYDADDQKKLMKSVLKSLDIEEKILSPKTALNLISRAKEQLISPEAFLLEMGNDYKMKLVSKAYDCYERKLAESNALDFDSIIVKTVELLRENKEVALYYQNRFRYVSVDEYQDTNISQFYLTALLAGGHGNLMAVGDDDQSIYKFRGATVENILSFQKKFGERTAVIKLEENYRSTQNILDAANQIISNNEKRMGKSLWTQNSAGEKIRVFNPEHQDSEARKIVSLIQKKVAAGEASFRDFAVLFRVNAQSNALEIAFSRSGIPYRVLGGVRFSDREEIRDIVAYLQLINNHSDEERLLRIINKPRRKLGDKTLEAVRMIATAEGVSMFEIMKRASSFVALSRSARSLEDFAKCIESLTDLKDELSLDEFVTEVMTRTGYRQMWIDYGEQEKERLENLDEFISNVVAYKESTEAPNLTEFLEINALVADVDRYDDTADAVVLMTIHSAKGLEFPYVFLPGFEDGVFPGMQSILEGPSEIEEERRLAYVAVTRAKKELYILHTKNRLMYGRTEANPASRFLGEISEDLLAYEKEPDNRFSRINPYYSGGSPSLGAGVQKAARESVMGARKPTAEPRPAFSAGDRVRHATFGAGTVLTVQKMGSDQIYEIAFDLVGTKKMMASYAKLEEL